jgi:cysteine desulfurase
MKTERIYLDYAASTPVDPRVLKAMMPYWNEKFGNPGSVHSFGQEALGAVDKARETVAKAVNANFREIIFTGSATEANNLALRGVLNSHKHPKIIISSIEHESVLETARDLEKEGTEVVYIPVDEKGVVDLRKLEEELNERTILISIMYVNNEIGSVQPIREISDIIKDFRARPAPPLRQSPGRRPSLSLRGGAESHSLYPIFHIDAAQAFNYFDCDVDKLGVDLMTLSGQKIYGPKGIGALYVRNPKLISPLVTGGGQEFGFRSGTENIPLIVGFSRAVELAVQERGKNIKKVSEMKDYFWRGLKKFYPQAEINGDSKTPHILNVFFPTEFAGDLLVKLDAAGIAVSAGSACTARAYAPSYVLQALELSPERVRGSLRFSFGKNNTRQELSAALKIINKTLS